MKPHTQAPLSFAQQRMWFLHQLDPGSPAYNVPIVLRLSGRLEVRALERSLNEIRRRHESLRTTFLVLGGRPMQVVSPFEPEAVRIVNLGEMEESGREEEHGRLVKEEVGRPFDLSRGPLLRTLLLRLGEEEHVLALTVHHIVSDGWSAGILFRELEALYGAFVSGEASPLRELGIQYKDFALWQRQALQGEALEEQLSYWRRQLGGRLPVLELPSDHARTGERGWRGGSEYAELPEDLSGRLRELSRQEGCTLFMTLLAAFAALLHRYTGEEDILVGTPIANRNRVETEELIGFFVNTLVMRVEVSGDPGFRELLGRVRELALDAYAHQDLPFERLVEELHPERDLSQSPLFQVMFVFDNVAEGEERLEGLTVSPIEVEGEAALFDLTLSVQDGGEGLAVGVEYRAELFEAETMRRLLGHYQKLLEEVVEDVERRISQLPLLEDEERRRVLVEWNDTKKKTRGGCVHELFEEQVGRTPEAVAVVFGEEELSYRELNERANRVAHGLRKRGVGPETLVGLCVERSLEMVVGLLGVLKAGGAYVPLDPGYPRERLALLLDDTGADVVLTQGRFLEALPEVAAGRAVCLDGAGPFADEPTANPPRTANAHNLVYVIYTSGSTGAPKGVMIEHASLTDRLDWMQEVYRFGPGDRFLQRAPFSFDVSVWEILFPLVNGACLVLCPPALHGDPVYLREAIARYRITSICFVPSLLELFLREATPESCRSLRLVICGGEPMSRRLEKAFFDLFAIDFHNLYGPTEACLHVTFWACRREHPWPTAPIGRPMSNTRVYVLDAHLEPVPVGVPGELCIGGVGVARGYWRRPELTAEKFVPDPFGETGARLYRTGDRARYLPDGNLEFLGRVDHQVKVRGFRVELGEIEAALAQHPEVRQAVVVAREDRPGDKRLVAYLVRAPGGEVSGRELRGFLKRKLPEYLVPAAFVPLESLPLTVHGKVDRRALPAPAWRDVEGGVLALPRSRVEEVLTALWKQVLGLEAVGIHDDFFELGGHSLLATQLVSRMRDAFQIELPLRHLFESPTIAQLAVRIDERREAAGTLR